MKDLSLKAGTKVKVDILGDVENVTIGEDFKVGLSKFKFITLYRDKGAPYSITVSRFLKSIVKK